MSAQEVKIKNFWIDSEIGRWEQNLLENEEWEDGIRISLQQTQEMVNAYWQEYLARFPIFPIPAELKTLPRENHRKLFSPKFGDWFTSLTSIQERGGSVVDTLSTIEKFLDEAPIGSLAAFISPPGPSNLHDASGKEYVYQDSQTYMYQKVDATHIRAFTVVSDLSLPETEQLLGLNTTTEKSRMERIQAVIHTPLLITATDHSISPHFIVDRIQSSMQSPPLARTHPPTSWDEIHYFLDHPDEIETAFTNTESLNEHIEEFKENIYDLPYDLEVILNTVAQDLPLLMLELSAAFRGHTGPINYAEEAGILSAIAGCSGEGDQDYSILYGLLGPRLVETDNCPSICCPRCGWKPNTDQLEKLKSGKLTACPAKNEDGRVCGYQPSAN